MISDIHRYFVDCLTDFYYCKKKTLKKITYKEKVFISVTALVCFHMQWVGPRVVGLWWGCKSWEKWVMDWKLSFHGKEQRGCRRGRMGLWDWTGTV